MSLANSRFLRACRGQPVDCTPIWLMRQAGRYLPEYRDVRARASFRELLSVPELAVEVTLQPIRRFELDAAIIFSDILVTTEAMGVPFEIEEQRGPVLARTVRTPEDLATLREVDPERDLAALLQAIRSTRTELPGHIPLLGFAGAPYTLACYLVEGGSSKEFPRMRRLCYSQPELAHALLERIAQAVLTSLRAQIAAGVSAIQLFDTWAGSLTPALFAEFSLPAIRTIMDGLADLDVPRILYVGDTGHYLHLLSHAAADIISVDWRIPLDKASQRLGTNSVLQGNLDPCALYLDATNLRRQVSGVLAAAQGLRGHIFNLGHGILPDVPPDHVAVLVDAVHSLSHRQEES